MHLDFHEERRRFLHRPEGHESESGVLRRHELRLDRIRCLKGLSRAHLSRHGVNGRDPPARRPDSAEMPPQRYAPPLCLAISSEGQSDQSQVHGHPPPRVRNVRRLFRPHARLRRAAGGGGARCWKHPKE